MNFVFKIGMEKAIFVYFNFDSKLFFNFQFSNIIAELRKYRNRD